jgi:hypothetical protein
MPTTLTGTQFHAEVTLTAATAYTVTAPSDANVAEVLNHDNTAWVYVTFDGSTPAVGGTSSWPVPPASSLRVHPTSSGATVVKLISSATPVVSVLFNDGRS